MPAELVDIVRFPVKGLSAEKLQRVTLTKGHGLPHDRRFAIARGDIDFDVSNPTWLRKTNFYMLMRNESLAGLTTKFNEETGVLSVSRDQTEVSRSVSRDQTEVSRANITTPAGRTEFEIFFTEFLGDESKDGSPRILEARDHMFGDASPKEGADSDKYVSLIGLESIRALEQHTGGPVDPIRFRANLHVEGLAAWEEFSWVGKKISIGTAQLGVLEPITRCAATQVNPATAERDLNIPKTLQQAFNHIYMGVYAEVMTGGDLNLGDSIRMSD